MSSKFVGAKKLFFSGFSKVFKGPQNQGKVATIGGVRPAKNLAKKRKVQDDIIKTREKVMTDYGVTKPEDRRDIRKTSNQSKINKRISKIVDKKADGGRIGRRFGGDTMKKSGGRAGFKGGGADTGRIGQLRSDLAIAKNPADNKAALKKADQDRHKFDKVAKAALRDRNK